MADLGQWLPGLPTGEELVAAAPMQGEWSGPAPSPWALPLLLLGNFAASFGVPIFVSSDLFWLVPFSYLALIVGVVIWRLLWRMRHPRPGGMAAVLDLGRKAGPVLMITRSQVLATSIARSPSFSGRAGPRGLAREIPGLVGIEAVGERLVLTFADGSQARLLQRCPTPGAADKVVALAAPVLQRHRDDSDASARGSPAPGDLVRQSRAENAFQG